MLKAAAKSAQKPRGIITISIAGLFILALFYTLYFARSLLMPIAIALLIDFLLSPAVRFLKAKFRIPVPAGAALLLLGILGIVVFSVAKLAAPASEWITRAPQTIRQVEAKVRTMAGPLGRAQQAAEQVDRATAQTSGSEGAATVQIAKPSIVTRLFGLTAGIFTAFVTTFFLAFFLLAADDLFLRKLIEIFPQSKTRGPAVTVAREIESGISRYLLVVSAINVGLGLATWGLFTLLGMPNAGLWGVVAGFANFIPYIGALAANVVFTAAAIVTFPTIGQALVVPGAFFVLNLLESYVITPHVLGRHFPLNPVAIFIGLMVWGWIWGVTGAILAVPILVMLKAICDHIEALEPFGSFLGD